MYHHYYPREQNIQPWTQTYYQPHPPPRAQSQYYYQHKDLSRDATFAARPTSVSVPRSWEDVDKSRGLGFKRNTRAIGNIFQYSRCTGRKKALCIGINYYGQQRELRGCINDARHIYEFLIRHCGYKKENIVMLTDDNPNGHRRPTKRNIIAGMSWLVKDACTHDSLFFHYSGHGGRTRDLSGDELDGYDEVIYPVDYQTAGFIVDDLMHDILVSPLPMGCRLTALFDCCHSGTVLDLPYGYDSNGNMEKLVAPFVWEQKKSSADVICWSGCLDGQKSSDTFYGGVPVGAMSYAFITAIKRNPNQSYQGLLRAIRQILYPKYSQTPQLASSHQIDTRLRFII